jgi:hypothetical protein
MTSFQPAHRGDLAVIVANHPDLGYQTVEITEVTSITRDGLVKAIRDTWDTTRPLARVLGVEQVLVVPKTEVDAAAVMKAAKAHTWPDHPNQPRHYESLDEVRALMAEHRQGSAPTKAESDR